MLYLGRTLNQHICPYNIHMIASQLHFVFLSRMSSVYPVYDFVSHQAIDPGIITFYCIKDTTWVVPNSDAVYSLQKGQSQKKYIYEFFFFLGVSPDIICLNLLSVRLSLTTFNCN